MTIVKDAKAKRGTGAKPRIARAGRPLTPLITRQAAAAAAMRLIDADGLDALSLQGVGKELGVSAPSLYHHFRDKEELLVEVARSLLNEIDHEQDSWSADWETRLVELSLATRRVALRHPHVAPLVLRFFPRALMLPAYEATLRDCPYPPEAHAVLLEVIEKFTYGSSLFAAAAEAHHIPAMPPVDEGHFPNLSRALAVSPADDETIHRTAFAVILDGLRVRYGAAG
jgi:TetR/AcrR family transcriptional regulator, tetracycline repressor protein